MKKMIAIFLILIFTFLIAAVLTDMVGAYSWKSVLGGGLYGSTGVALKVESDGTLYIRD